MRALELCTREEPDSKEIARVIEKDPVLVSRVLRMVNCSRFRVSTPVKSVLQAIVLIGTDAVRNIALCACVREVFGEANPCTSLDEKRFWRHSLTCAVLARSIAQNLGNGEPEEAFLAGLLHDIGKLVLCVSVPVEYGRILKESAGDTDRLLAAEWKLGIVHSDVSARLLNTWGLSQLLSDAARYHHEPLYRVIDAFPLIKIVYAAHRLAGSDTAQAEHESKDTARLLGITPTILTGLRNRAEKEVTEVAESLDLQIGPAETSEEKTRAALKREVKHVSLIVGTLPTLLRATDDGAVAVIFQQGMKMLLGLTVEIFFTYDCERDILIGMTLGDRQGEHSRPDLVVRGESETGMLVSSFRTNDVLDSFSYGKRGSLTVADEHLVRLLGGRGIVCLPVVLRGEKLGVFVLPVDEGQVSTLRSGARLVRLLLHQAAAVLSAQRLRDRELHGARMERALASSQTAHRVVHEASNPLGIIKNYLAILQEKLGGVANVQAEVRTINEEIDRVVGLLMELSEFSDQRVSELSSVALNDVIGELVPLYQRSESGSGAIEVRLELDGGVPKVLAHQEHIRQIVVNLMTNAAEAMPEGGTLTVSTGFLDTYPDLPGSGTVSRRRRKRGWVSLSVEDEGPGLSESVRVNLFEPYTTTKGEGHRGLGLAIVHNLVRQMKGGVACRNGRRGGTSLTVFLPTDQEVASHGDGA